MEIWGTDRFGRLLMSLLAGSLGLFFALGSLMEGALIGVVAGLFMLAGAWKLGRLRTSRTLLQDETLESMRSLVRPILTGVALVLCGIGLLMVAQLLTDAGAPSWLVGGA